MQNSANAFEERWWKYENDKPWKNQIGKVSSSLLTRPVPAPILPPHFLIFQISPLKEVIEIHSPPLSPHFVKGGVGSKLCYVGPNAILKFKKAFFDIKQKIFPAWVSQKTIKGYTVKKF